MKALAWSLVVAGIGVILFFPAGTPSLENSYILTANRWQQGKSLYAQLSSCLDPLFTLGYHLGEDMGSAALRIWKAWGLVAQMLFFLPLASPSIRAKSYGIPLIGLWISLSALRRWHLPVEVGEPALWSLLILYRSRKYAFEQGILWATTSILFPMATPTILWYIFQRIEERNFTSLFFSFLGGVWGTLGAWALMKWVGEENYWKAYWVEGWVPLLKTWDWRNGLAGAALILLLSRSRAYQYQPYFERKLYLGRLWAAISTIGIPTLGGGAVWHSLLAENFNSRLWLNAVRLVILFQGGVLGVHFFSLPKCSLLLPAQSCVWGELPCYIKLSGTYGCDYTSSYTWMRLYKKGDWEKLYRGWGRPQLILDAANAWSDFQYHLPYLCQGYSRKDTLIHHATLYHLR
ncbi:MAG: hypothetical protein RMJ66_00705 [Bacteroidia bacterium]|nr:hypothetical protein [Bacteroidia bacterium]MDW8133564.1 hypothetical protein [Bacteroidia bacterium]